MHKPDDALLEARLSAVDPVAYAANRNHLGGAVTGLSPWVTHGCISIPELIERFSLTGQDMLAFQLGWRAFFQHVWGHLGDGILADISVGVRRVALDALQAALPTLDGVGAAYVRGVTPDVAGLAPVRSLDATQRQAVLNTLLPKVGLGAIFRGVWPYVVVQIVTLVILLLVPQISLWLPSMMR